MTTGEIVNLPLTCEFFLPTVNSIRASEKENKRASPQCPTGCTVGHRGPHKPLDPFHTTAPGRLILSIPDITLWLDGPLSRDHMLLRVPDLS